VGVVAGGAGHLALQEASTHGETLDLADEANLGTRLSCHKNCPLLE